MSISNPLASASGTSILCCMFRFFLASILLSLLVSCSSTPRYIENNDYHTHNTTPNAPQSPRLLTFALQQQGIPYRYGGNNPRKGFDCSGLIQFSYAQVGKRIPRTTRQQFQSRQPVSLSQIRPGDLLFYETEGRRPGHVALYLGRGEMIHAPSSGKQVKISRLNNPYWRKRFIAAGRF